MLLTLKCMGEFNDVQLEVLNQFSYNAYKLWNVANYEKHNYKELGIKYPDWYDQKKRLNKNFFYKNLPSQTAQEVLNTLEQGWSSFFEKIVNDKTARPPKYKKKGIFFSILNNGFKVVDNKFRITIPKQLKNYLKSKGINLEFLIIDIPQYLLVDNIKQIRFYPVDGSYEIHVIYEIEDINLFPDNNKYLSIDLGINNFFSCYSNINDSFIINGSKFVELTQMYSKRIAKLQSQLEKNQHSSKQIKSLYRRKTNRIYDLLHQTTAYIIKYCLKNNINTVVIGDIKNIRKNIGKVNNLKLHSLPYDKLYKLLEYKCLKNGINFIKQKESYTSQCPPDSKTVSKKYAVKKNRIYRGLYKDGKNSYNADVVGAYNILRLYLNNKKIETKLPFNFNPKKIYTYS